MYLRRQLEQETQDRLFDVISGFYSLFDNGYKPKQQQVNAALIACEVLENKHKVYGMQEEINTIKELAGVNNG